jgi:hypothetical protein
MPSSTVKPNRLASSSRPQNSVLENVVYSIRAEVWILFTILIPRASGHDGPFEVAFILQLHNEFNESSLPALHPFRGVTFEINKNLELERPLTRDTPCWHYAVPMRRGRQNLSQMARKLEPLPAGWSEMSIRDAMHLLHLHETSPMTTSDLRTALENALERAKFDEIPLLLGAYRILEGHFGGPEGAATRQDDPTSASWPTVSEWAVKLDPWEDDPSITVSDIRMIEPTAPAPQSLSTSSSSKPWFQTDNDPQQILIDDFNPHPLDVRAGSTQGFVTNVVQPPGGNAARAHLRLGVPGLLALGVAGLLVLWAYHPFAQGLVATFLGKAPSPIVAASESPPTATQVLETTATEDQTVEATPDAISSAPVMLQAPKVFRPKAEATPASRTSNGPDSSKSSPTQSSPTQSSPNKPAFKKQSSNQSTPNKLIAGQPASSVTSVVVASNATPTKAGVQTKPTKAARQPISTQLRATKPRPTKPQPTLIGVQTTKAIQAAQNAVTQVPKATVGQALRVSNQARNSGETGTPINATAKNTNPKSDAKNTRAKNAAKADVSITNPIKFASSNERDAAASRAIANPQPVASIQAPKASGKIDNLSREEFGQRYFNRKLFEVWQRDDAKLRYASWDEIPLELQILENDLFRSAIYLNGPSANEAKDNENPAQP